MPNFQYTATDQTGPNAGPAEAANEQQAYEQLAQYDRCLASYSPDPPASSKSNEVAQRAGKKKKKVYWPLNLVEVLKGGYFCIYPTNVNIGTSWITAS